MEIATGNLCLGLTEEDWYGSIREEKKARVELLPNKDYGKMLAAPTCSKQMPCITCAKHKNYTLRRTLLHWNFMPIF